MEFNIHTINTYPRRIGSINVFECEYRWHGVDVVVEYELFGSRHYEITGICIGHNQVPNADVMEWAHMVDGPERVEHALSTKDHIAGE